MPILARLDPAVDLVVSGHTHNAYICDYGRIDPSRPFLVTSAGTNGALLTDIAIVDRSEAAPGARQDRRQYHRPERGLSRRGRPGPADQRLFPRYRPDPAVAALVARYAAAAAPIIARPIGRMQGAAHERDGAIPANRCWAIWSPTPSSPPRARPRRAARASPSPTRPASAPTSCRRADGSINFGQLFAVQPFGNNLVVMSMTGRQIRALLEQQFASGSNSVSHPIMLLPSRGLTYSYDLSPPAGSANPRPQAGRRPDRRRERLSGRDEQLPRHRRRQFHAVPRGHRSAWSGRWMWTRSNIMSPPPGPWCRRRPIG